MIEIEVRLFGNLREHRPELKPGEAIRVTLREGATASTLLEKLGIPEETVKVVFVNGLITSSDHVLEANDRVGIFPPVAGGCPGPGGCGDRGNRPEGGRNRSERW
jgi:molybdopterin converting factor small subunit